MMIVDNFIWKAQVKNWHIFCFFNFYQNNTFFDTPIYDIMPSERIKWKGNMKKLFLTSAILATMVCPSFADNITTTNNDCDNTTLTTYSGSAALEADWSPNTVNVTYYNGENVYGNGGECTYDSTLTLPTAPSKNGYTFAGWKVKTALTPSLFDLSTLSGYMYDDGTYFVSKNLNQQRCEGAYVEWNDEDGEYDNDFFGTDEGENCSDPRFAHLGTGEWSTTFDYGTTKGVALCSSTSGTKKTTGIPDETGGGLNCWCKATDFAEGNNSNYSHVSSSLWVLNDGYRNASDCANDCAFYCAYRLKYDSVFRRAVFGVSQ